MVTQQYTFLCVSFSVLSNYHASYDVIKSSKIKIYILQFTMCDKNYIYSKYIFPKKKFYEFKNTVKF